MESKKKENGTIFWHPAFYADLQIELIEDADSLEFENEHQLGTRPMEIDVLIIKKDPGYRVKKNIGRIFRKYNIVEYKGPGDSLSIDDFYKVYGYTCFYKSDVPSVDSISAEELTITFVAEMYPQRFIRHLREIRKYEVTETENGVYQVMGDFIPIQIIVTKRLSGKENLWLKSLTNRLDETGDAQALMASYLQNKGNKLYRSVIETIMRANQETFKEVNGMSDIFMEICQEKFDRKLKEETEKAVEKAVEKAAEEAAEKTAEEVKKTKLVERIILIQKKCAKKKTLSVIADELETGTDEILPIYNVVIQNPGKSSDEIYELIGVVQ